jgi:hypothetical protein
MPAGRLGAWRNPGDESGIGRAEVSVREWDGRGERQLKTAVPAVSRVALLSTTPGKGGHEIQLAEAEQAAPALGISVKPYRVSSLSELPPAVHLRTRDSPPVVETSFWKRRPNAPRVAGAPSQLGAVHRMAVVGHVLRLRRSKVSGLGEDGRHPSGTQCRGWPMECLVRTGASA